MDDVEHRVHNPVASEVEPVTVSWPIALAGRLGDRGCAAPSGELAFGGEPVRVTDLSNQRHGHDGTDAVDLDEGAPDLGEQRRHLLVEILDSPVDRADRGLDDGPGGPA
jgi:hypothetical protein